MDIDKRDEHGFKKLVHICLVLKDAKSFLRNSKNFEFYLTAFSQRK